MESFNRQAETMSTLLIFRSLSVRYPCSPFIKLQMEVKVDKEKYKAYIERPQSTISSSFLKPVERTPSQLFHPWQCSSPLSLSHLPLSSFSLLWELRPQQLMLLPPPARLAAYGVRAMQHALLAASHNVKGSMADIATPVCYILIFFPRYNYS